MDDGTLVATAGRLEEQARRKRDTATDHRKVADENIAQASTLEREADDDDAQAGRTNAEAADLRRELEVAAAAQSDAERQLS